jgi:hypothetical protein
MKFHNIKRAAVSPAFSGYPVKEVPCAILGAAYGCKPTADQPPLDGADDFTEHYSDGQTSRESPCSEIRRARMTHT